MAASPEQVLLDSRTPPSGGPGWAPHTSLPQTGKPCGGVRTHKPQSACPRDQPDQELVGHVWGRTALSSFNQSPSDPNDPHGRPSDWSLGRLPAVCHWSFTEGRAEELSQGWGRQAVGTVWRSPPRQVRRALLSLPGTGRSCGTEGCVGERSLSSPFYTRSGPAPTAQALRTDSRPVAARLEAQGGSTGSKTVQTNGKAIHAEAGLLRLQKTWRDSFCGHSGATGCAKCASQWTVSPASGGASPGPAARASRGHQPEAGRSHTVTGRRRVGRA